MNKLAIAAVGFALVATPASAHGWGGHGWGGGGFGFFPFFPLFVPAPYYYPPPYYPPPYYGPPQGYYGPQRPPPVTKDEMPVTPPDGADWRYRPGHNEPLPEYEQ